MSEQLKKNKALSSGKALNKNKAINGPSYLRNLRNLKKKVRIPDSELRKTEEYKSYTNKNLVWGKDDRKRKFKKVEEDEALAACRLMLDDMTEKNKSINWEKEAREYVLKFRDKKSDFGYNTKIIRPHANKKSFLKKHNNSVKRVVQLNSMINDKVKSTEFLVNNFPLNPVYNLNLLKDFIPKAYYSKEDKINKSLVMDEIIGTTIKSLDPLPRFYDYKIPESLLANYYDNREYLHYIVSQSINAINSSVKSIADYANNFPNSFYEDLNEIKIAINEGINELENLAHVISEGEYINYLKEYYSELWKSTKKSVSKLYNIDTNQIVRFHEELFKLFYGFLITKHYPKYQFKTNSSKAIIKKHPTIIGKINEENIKNRSKLIIKNRRLLFGSHSWKTFEEVVKQRLVYLLKKSKIKEQITLDVKHPSGVSIRIRADFLIQFPDDSFKIIEVKFTSKLKTKLIEIAHRRLTKSQNPVFRWLKDMDTRELLEIKMKGKKAGEFQDKIIKVKSVDVYINEGQTIKINRLSIFKK